MPKLRSTDGLLAPAVAETIRHLAPTKQDAAAVKLAQRYAITIDEATNVAADLAASLAEATYDDDIAKRLYTLAKRVEAQTVLADLGPKLLAALESLGATPAARARLRGGAPARAQSRLQALRETRRAG